MNIQNILDRCKETNIHMIRHLYCDNSGIIRGKVIAVKSLIESVKDGIGLPTALTAANNLDRIKYSDVIGPVGEVRLLPDIDTFVHLPYSPRSGVVFCDIYAPNRLPWDGCSRSFLKRVINDGESLGVHLRAAFEVEFTLATKQPDGHYLPLNQTVTYSSIAMTMVAKIIDEMVDAIEAQGMQVEQYYPECAYGLHELTIHHSPVLEAAENHIKMKETIRGVAWNHNLYASFAPKLWPETFGIFAQNSAHVHFSLWDDDGNNLFYDEIASDHLSKKGRSFLAGVLDHLPGLIALTCPSVNSYRRLQQKGNLSGSVVGFGHNNRDVAVRIVPPTWTNPEKTINLELRPVDSSCNPYLALGGLFAAGLDGVRRELELGEPLDKNPAKLNEDEQQKMKFLPSNLDAALNALEEDTVLLKSLGTYLASLYISVRRSEANDYRDKDTEFEILNHFYKY